MKRLKGFKKICVTGPQRSGTTICAKMLSVDYDLQFFKEEAFGIGSKEGFARLIRAHDNFVVQCPAVSRHIHELVDDDMAVVWMRRSLKDVVASEKRINWNDYHERLAYKAMEDKRPIATIKNSYWKKHQKNKIKNSFEIKFDSLKNHELFLPDSARSRFEPRQISL